MKVFLLLLPFLFTAWASEAQNTVNCSPAQISTVATAQGLIPGKIDNVLPSVGNTPLFETWFGAYDAGRADTVRQNLGTIKSYAVVSQPEYTCVPNGQGSCDGDTIAYIVAGTSFDISLCDPFFNLGTFGDNTTWGTILHEMTHFALGPATSDECYGTSTIGSCRDLAIANPALAIQNADNYQYFVEQLP